MSGFVGGMQEFGSSVRAALIGGTGFELSFGASLQQTQELRR